MRVASVASVGAMSSPTRALTSVDLPAFSVPASAMRIGWLSRPADPVQFVEHVRALPVGRIGPVGARWCRPGWRAPDRCAHAGYADVTGSISLTGSGPGELHAPLVRRRRGAHQLAGSSFSALSITWRRMLS